MAREEQDREDLLDEATALVERAELEIDGQSIVVGFRRDGSASVYFGSDPVYQFNTAGALRRAFVDGLMIKAVDGRLASLTRHRTADEVQLVRHDLSSRETQHFLALMTASLETLRAQLRKGHHRVVGQHPPESPVMQKVHDWLKELPAKGTIAESPSVR